jgi:hypothetical protein
MSGSIRLRVDAHFGDQQRIAVCGSLSAGKMRRLRQLNNAGVRSTPERRGRVRDNPNRRDNFCARSFERAR